MKQTFKRAFYAAVACVPLLVAAGGAHAITAISQTTYSWTGTCVDVPPPNGCGTEPASATLVLQNYTFGTPVSNPNFVSFAYHSSLFANLTASPSELILMGGVLPGPPGGPADFSLQWWGGTSAGDFYVFSTHISGDWTLFEVDRGVTDIGTGSTFATGVPEPASLALLATALGAFGLSRRRKKA